jgi:hypothetical protein
MLDFPHDVTMKPVWLADEEVNDLMPTVDQVCVASKRIQRR